MYNRATSAPPDPGKESGKESEPRRRQSRTDQREKYAHYIDRRHSNSCADHARPQDLAGSRPETFASVTGPATTGRTPGRIKRTKHIRNQKKKLSTRQNLNKKGRRSEPKFRHPDFSPLEKSTDLFFGRIFLGSEKTL